MLSQPGLIRDRWFLVLDPEYASSMPPAGETVTIESNADAQARRYQHNSHRFVGSLSLGEVWSILNPFSIARFLRFSMADVF
tara:strand:+ start:131 stop:376 length:246 start_codon:yes stop_codon:yes gene_type:complete